MRHEETKPAMDRGEKVLWIAYFVIILFPGVFTAGMLVGGNAKAFAVLMFFLAVYAVVVAVWTIRFAYLKGKASK